MSQFNLEGIRKAAEELLEKAGSPDALNAIRTRFLGKKGELAEAKKLSEQIEKEIKERREEMEKALQDKRLLSETIDVTLPGKKIRYGHPHPNTLALEEVEKIFTGMGYEVVEGPEVEYDSYNFEKLNIPKGHPARDEQDKNRAVAPLRQAEDAILVDTSSLSIDEVVEVIIKIACEKNPEFNK